MSGTTQPTTKPQCVDLNGDVLMFRVIENDKLLDRIYVRDPLLGKDLNVWLQVPNYRLYAAGFDKEEYEKNWPYSEHVAKFFRGEKK